MIRLSKLAMVCIAVLGAWCGVAHKAEAVAVLTLPVADGTVIPLAGFANDPAQTIFFSVQPPKNLAVYADFSFDPGTAVVSTAAVPGITIQLFDNSTVIASAFGFTHAAFSYLPLFVGHIYSFSVQATSSGGGTYDGTLTFAAAPIPPALLMFGTALAAIGGLGVRRRAASAA